MDRAELAEWRWTQNRSVGKEAEKGHQGGRRRPETPPSLTYLMPVAPDIPHLETVLVTVPTEEGPFGARAVAEPPGFGPPAAIANAVEHAVGVRIKELPLTGERVLAAVRGEIKEPQLDLSFLGEEGRPRGPVGWQTSG